MMASSSIHEHGPEGSDALLNRALLSLHWSCSNYDCRGICGTLPIRSLSLFPPPPHKHLLLIASLHIRRYLRLSVVVLDLPVIRSPPASYPLAMPSVEDIRARLLGAAISIGTMYVAFRFVVKPFYAELMHAPDPKEAESKRTARSSLQRHFAASRRSVPETNQYEERLIADLVFPEQMDTTLDDIGGLEQLKQEMYETVILPLRSPHILAAMQRPANAALRAQDSNSAPSSSSLLAAPRGVLLYGPPGCGKVSLTIHPPHTSHLIHQPLPSTHSLTSSCTIAVAVYSTVTVRL